MCWATRSCSFAAPRQRSATSHRAQRRPSEPTVLKVLECLLQLLARVHDEGPVLGDRLAQRAAGDENGSGDFAPGARRDTFEADLATLSEHAELVSAQHTRPGRRTDLDRAFEDVQKCRIVR